MMAIQLEGWVRVKNGEGFVGIHFHPKLITNWTSLEGMEEELISKI